jgi:hypothetical protein
MESTLNSTKTWKLQFDLHTRLLNNVLDGINDSMGSQRADDKTNHVRWLAGHLASVRIGMSKLGEQPVSNPWGELFKHGEPLNTEADYPSITEIKAKWQEATQALEQGLLQLPEEAFEAKAPAQTPIADASLGGYIAFLMHHEAYHIGQMGILRKYMGLDSMSYS